MSQSRCCRMTEKTHLSSRLWNPALFKLQHRKLGSIPKLIAELAIPLNTKDLQIDVASSRRIRTQRKAERIRPTLRYTLGEIFLLPLLRFGDLFFVQIAIKQFDMQVFERETLDDVDWVDHVSERFRHFSAMCVADHGVAEDFGEGHSVCEAETEHDHSCDPEEQNVPSCLQHGGRVKVLEICRLDKEGISKTITYYRRIA